MQTEQIEQLNRQIHTIADEHPLLTVAGAFGVGYLLSGALYSRATAKLLGIGARLLFGAMLRDAVDGALFPRRSQP
jgi:hypothetical protein